MTTPEVPRQTTIRFDVDVRAMLDDYARRTRRTINAAVNQLVGDALAEEARQQGHQS